MIGTSNVSIIGNLVGDTEFGEEEKTWFTVAVDDFRNGYKTNEGWQQNACFVFVSIPTWMGRKYKEGRYPLKGDAVTIHGYLSSSTGKDGKAHLHLNATNVVTLLPAIKKETRAESTPKAQANPRPTGASVPPKMKNDLEPF
jgi:primosomal replication protein N